MSMKVFLIDSNQARYTGEEFSFLNTQLLDEGVLNKEAGNDDLKVIENSPAAMNVLVSPGASLVSYLKNGITWKVFVVSAAEETLTITANSSGSNRVDAIVLELDQDEPNALKNNVASVSVALGSGVSALSDGAIDTLLGHTNWIRLADVTVANGATSIVTADITDARVAVTVGKNTGGYRTIFQGDGGNLHGVLHSPIDEDLLPDTDSTYDLGSVSLAFANAYADYYYGDGSNLTNVVSAGGAKNFVLGEAFPATDFPRIVQESGSLASAGQIYSTNWKAQTFTTPSDMTVITEIHIKMDYIGSTAGTLALAIRATSSGSPTGSSLASTTISSIDITPSTTSPDFLVWKLSTPLTVSASTVYAIIFSCSAGSSGNCPRLNYVTSSNVYSGGQYLESANSGSSWTSPGAYDCHFRVFGNTTSKIYPMYIEDGSYSDLVYYRETGTTNYGSGIYTTNWEAFTFIADNFDYITYLAISFSKTGTVSVGVTVSLYATDSSGHPTGSALWSDTSSVTGGAIGTNTEFILTPNLSITQGSRYAVVISVPSGGTSSNYIRVNAGENHAHGRRLTSSNSGSTWTNGVHNGIGFTGRIHGYKQRTAGRIYRCDPRHPDRMVWAGSLGATTEKSEGDTVQLRLAGGLVESLSGFSQGQDVIMDLSAQYDTTYGDTALAFTAGYMLMEETYLSAGEIRWAKALDTTTIEVLRRSSQFICSLNDSGQTLSGTTYIKAPKKARYAVVYFASNPNTTNNISGDAIVYRYGKTVTVAHGYGDYGVTITWDDANGRISIATTGGGGGTRLNTTANFFA